MPDMLPRFPRLAAQKLLHAPRPSLRRSFGLRRAAPALAAGAACFAALALGPSIAGATETEKKVISTDVALGGDYLYDEFTVKSPATVKVVAYKEGDTKATGKLSIRANKIVIEAGAMIEASGAGYPGVEGGDGKAAMSSNGGGHLGGLDGLPGGGGGYAGLGAPGADMLCQPIVMSAGGASFFMMALDLGSAGGAANVMPLGPPAGGNGGGWISLSAAIVTIDGTLKADGASSFANSGVGPGGGSGGSIQIVASLLEGSGLLTAIGGNGVHGMGSTNPMNPIPVNNGGGGSGGVVLITAPMTPATLMVDVAGGKTGDCPAAADGGAGQHIDDAAGAGCVDIDGDGFTSKLCGGMDCDDSDDDTNPDSAESCDGRDNDCNGTPDDGSDLCSPGSECTAGHCNAIPDAGGPDASVDGGSPPDHVTFAGGCGVPGPREIGTSTTAAGGAITIALAALAASVGRRRRSGGRARSKGARGGGDRG